MLGGSVQSVIWGESRCAVKLRRLSRSPFRGHLLPLADIDILKNPILQLSYDVIAYIERIVLSRWLLPSLQRLQAY
jgi:hypothetical protein